MKTCSKCKEVKTVGDFFKNRMGRDGLRSECKPCHYKSVRAWEHRNPLKVAVSSRKGRLKWLFGLSVESYERMLLEQGGVCKICGETNQSGKRLSVDHDHKTGVVRGLLCQRCNVAIGLLVDSPERLRAAASYLDKPDSLK